MIRAIAVAATLVLAAPAWSARAAGGSEDWPCVQRLVPELTQAALWSGPDLDAVEGFWQADPEIAPMVRDLIDLGAEEAAARAEIDAFADAIADDAERAQRLTLLFKAVLESVNGERDRMIRGIERYAREQKALADQIAADSVILHGVRLDGSIPLTPEQEEVTMRRSWDIRVFDDRASMMTLICEQPVLLEQRAFALSRAVQRKL